MTRGHVLVLGLAAAVLALAPPDLWPLSAAAVGLATVAVVSEAIGNTSDRYGRQRRQEALQRHRIAAHRRAAQIHPENRHGPHSARTSTTGRRH